MQKEAKKKLVFVGLSGGVDSAVSAALLKDQGYDVVGVYLRTWQPDWIPCTWQDERRDAMRVCAHLDIPFVEHVVSQQYFDLVTKDMIANYQKGYTPNPDVLCNKEIKFGLFYNWARKQGADYVATGHYAQKEVVSLKSIDYRLKTGLDTAKDQTYFLWTLSSDILAHTLFPVGGMLKTQVRELAKKYNLPVADKKDSQGICFLGLVDMKEFLSHYITVIKGDVVNTSGEKIGTHDGVQLYTYGERHGFTIHNTAGALHEPLYVVGRDIAKNILTVGIKAEYQALGKNRTTYTLSKVVMRSPLSVSETLQGVLRYHGKKYAVQVVAYNSTKQSMIVQFENPDELIAAGQSVVFYQDAICIGGGIVEPK